MPIIDSKNIYGLIERTLNKVDARLVGHGARVAYTVRKMLETKGGYSDEKLTHVSFLALLHDVGAYKTEEIDQMVRFETANIWEHSIYGYLFLKTMSPLSDLAEAVLFHHLDYDKLKGENAPYKDIAQMINLADRADIFLYEEKGKAEDFINFVKREKGRRFDPEIADLFMKAQERFCMLGPDRYGRQSAFDTVVLEDGEIDSFLKMIVFAIDFRSAHTVTHTITTTQISRQLALIMGLTEKQVEKVYYGALLHDLGKIGIPVEILEFSGKLSPQAMSIMKTHVLLTEDILSHSVEKTVADIALRHHEKLDGSGYPKGISGEKLTLSERIVAVADIVSALCGTRSYKHAYPKQKVVDIITRMSDRGLIDGDVVFAMSAHYDVIMERVYEACEPAIRNYHEIHEQYEALYKKLTGAKSSPQTLANRFFE